MCIYKKLYLYCAWWSIKIFNKNKLGQSEGLNIKMHGIKIPGIDH